MSSWEASNEIPRIFCSNNLTSVPAALRELADILEASGVIDTTLVALDYSEWDGHTLTAVVTG